MQTLRDYRLQDNLAATTGAVSTTDAGAVAMLFSVSVTAPVVTAGYIVTGCMATSRSMAGASIRGRAARS